MSMYGKNQHNTVNYPPINKKYLKKKNGTLKEV